ncbi:pseudouridine synthase [Iodidimonas sp. MBR-22]|nr:pseudouridine synthase [Iodidimonas sp. MBR-22]
MTKDNPTPKATQERIAKALARAGIGSRREVERMIEAGRVAINGQILKSPACVIETLDGIAVDGKPVMQAEATRLWRYHKPRGLVSTHHDPNGRPTVFDRLPSHLPRVISVGRLDLNSEGLLLLTNDGALARWMEMPTTGWLRRYKVRVHGAIDEKKLQGLAEGVVVDGVVYEPIEARLDKISGSNAWLSVGLREGKNREVRRVLASIGLEVNRLIRTAYGPFTLGSLPRGAVVEIATKALYTHCGGILGQMADQSIAGQNRKIPNPKKWAKAKPKAKLRSRRSTPRDPMASAESATKVNDKAKGAAKGAAKPVRGNRPKDGRD